MIIGITGGPQTGKSTLALKLQSNMQCYVLHTDEYKHLKWAEQPYAVIKRSSEYADDLPLFVEGVQVPRAIRKGMPCDLLVVLKTPFVMLSTAQLTMAKGLQTIIGGLQVQTLQAENVDTAYDWICGFVRESG